MRSYLLHVPLRRRRNNSSATSACHISKDNESGSQRYFSRVENTKGAKSERIQEQQHKPSYQRENFFHYKKINCTTNQNGFSRQELLWGPARTRRTGKIKSSPASFNAFKHFFCFIFSFLWQVITIMFGATKKQKTVPIKNNSFESNGVLKSGNFKYQKIQWCFSFCLCFLAVLYWLNCIRKLLQ